MRNPWISSPCSCCFPPWLTSSVLHSPLACFGARGILRDCGSRRARVIERFPLPCPGAHLKLLCALSDERATEAKRNVQVFLRIRGRNDMKAGEEVALKPLDDNQTVLLQFPGGRKEEVVVDRVFGESASNEDVSKHGMVRLLLPLLLLCTHVCAATSPICGSRTQTTSAATLLSAI